METYLANYLIVVLCGYCHIYFRPSLKYKYEGEEQSSIAFKAFLYGFIFYLVAFCINYIAEYCFFDFLQKNLIKHKHQLSVWHLFTVINSMNNYPRIIWTNILLTICTSNITFDILLRNHFLNKFNWEKGKGNQQSFRLKQREKNTSEPEKTIVSDFGFSEKSKIIITLKNRKVYTGESHDYDPDESWDKSYVSIIPLKSGYRDIKDLSFHITQNYECIRRNIRNETRDNINKEIRTMLNNANHSNITYEKIIKDVKKIGVAQLSEAEEKIKRLSTPIIINKREILTVAIWHDDFYDPQTSENNS